MPNSQYNFSKFSGTTARVYSARAELPQDVPLVVNACRNALPNTAVSCLTKPLGGGIPGPDVSMVLTFDAPVDFAQLLSIIGGLDDCHIILESLKPCALADNKLDREYGRGLSL